MPQKKGTLHNFFHKPKTPGNLKAASTSAQESLQQPSSSKRRRENSRKSDTDLLNQLTTPQPVSQPNTPALGPRRKKLRALLGDGEDKQTASYRLCSWDTWIAHAACNQ